MTTAYSREQLAALSREMDANAPPDLTRDDLMAAKTITRARFEATELGVVLWLAAGSGKAVQLFLNPALLVELLYCIDVASEANGWQLTKQNPPLLHSIDEPLALSAAVRVSSLRLGSEAKGAVLAVTDGKTISRYYLPLQLIASIFGTVGLANKTVGWWDDDMALIPNDGTKLQ
jgi:hypothetical protein